jgi:hypothetical protein
VLSTTELWPIAYLSMQVCTNGPLLQTLSTRVPGSCLVTTVLKHRQWHGNPQVAGVMACLPHCLTSCSRVGVTIEYICSALAFRCSTGSVVLISLLWRRWGSSLCRDGEVASGSHPLTRQQHRHRHTHTPCEGKSS